MKKVLFILFVLVSFSGFAQAEKDSLVEVDKEAILDKLELMFYLDQEATKCLTMTKEKQAELDKTFPYYFMNAIVKNNPSTLDLREFIGFDFKEFKPIKGKDFYVAVYEENLVEFIDMTKKYGYLSTQRLKRYKDAKAYSPLIFVIHNSYSDKEVKKLMKQEFKIGNIDQKEYDQFKFFLERKKELTDDDVARFEKIGGKILKS